MLLGVVPVYIMRLNNQYFIVLINYDYGDSFVSIAIFAKISPKATVKLGKIHLLEMFSSE